MIKAIETVYNGYRFRSRLEARWAVFFDTLGIEYQYEPEGFDLGEAGWYLPDFWLPEQKCWIEIKGRKNLLQEEWAKYLALGTEKPLFTFCGSVEIPIYHLPNWTLESGSFARAFLPLVNKTNGEPIGQVSLDPRPWIWQQRREDGSFVIWPFPALEPARKGETPILTFFFDDEHGIDILAPMTKKNGRSKDLRKAYTAARQARFEKGAR